MSDITDDIVDDAAAILHDGYIDFDKYSFLVTDAIRFRDKTITEWIEACKLPNAHSNMSHEQHEDLNYKFLSACEIVQTNFSIARSAMEMAKLQFRTAVMEAKDNIIREIETNNANSSNTKKRVPGAELLEEMAKHACSIQYRAYYTAKIFYVFWEEQSNKINMNNYRLTSISTIKNIESKVGH